MHIVYGNTYNKKGIFQTDLREVRTFEYLYKII